MTRRTIYARHPLAFADEDETYQTYGDLRFYRNGGASLGSTMFVRGTPIHRYRFGANLVASRHIDQPCILEIETPFGQRLRFKYGRLFRKWYQLVEVSSPALYFVQERYGMTAALALYHLGWALGWVISEALQVLLSSLAFFVLILLLNVMF